jgi:hypothetical protein
MKLAPSMPDMLASAEKTPSPAKLAAWAHVRAIWQKMGKYKEITQELLDAEWVAANTD